MGQACNQAVDIYRHGSVLATALVCSCHAPCLRLRLPSALLPRAAACPFAYFFPVCTRLLARSPWGSDAGPALLGCAPLCSFGILLWEICSGEHPLRGRNRELRVPQECPQEMVDLVEQVGGC